MRHPGRQFFSSLQEIVHKKWFTFQKTLFQYRTDVSESFGHACLERDSLRFANMQCSYTTCTCSERNAERFGQSRRMEPATGRRSLRVRDSLDSTCDKRAHELSTVGTSFDFVPSVRQREFHADAEEGAAVPSASSRRRSNQSDSCGITNMWSVLTTSGNAETPVLRQQTGEASEAHSSTTKKALKQRQKASRDGHSEGGRVFFGHLNRGWKR